MFGPDPIGADAIATLVDEAWALGLESVEYAAIGYGSYHWHGFGTGARWLVTVDSVDQRPVAAAYELAHRLGDRLGFVRSPWPRLDGGIILADGNWLISVWPWVTGQSGSFAEPRSPGDLAAAAGCLRELHDCTDIPQVSALVEEWDIPGRALLEDVVAQPIWGEPEGPYSSEVAARIDANRSRIQGLFAQYDSLAARVWDEAEFVITHGEPHAGNFVHTESGAVLIDWDTVRWAPRERDLWWLPADGWQKSYGEDVSPSEPAMELYRLKWTLCDIADFVPQLVTAAEPTPDFDAAMGEIKRLLSL